MLCWLLSYRHINQPQVYICPLPCEPTSHQFSFFFKLENFPKVDQLCGKNVCGKDFYGKDTSNENTEHNIKDANS